MPMIAYYIMFVGNPLDATFALVIEGAVVARLKDFLPAMTMLFAAYYVFNFEYGKEVAGTLEFIQR